MTFEPEIKLDMWKNREPIVNKQDYNKAEKPSVKTAWLSEALSTALGTI